MSKNVSISPAFVYGTLCSGASLVQLMLNSRFVVNERLIKTLK